MNIIAAAKEIIVKRIREAEEKSRQKREEQQDEKQKNKIQEDMRSEDKQRIISLENQLKELSVLIKSRLPPPSVVKVKSLMDTN